ncbi:angiopoietin-related protein 1-like [Anopheles merus]|uniref:angiopoietin-related protein 1-like n=1 Tax=Anopheles merus TaxID=30066 RepID=UPI001BE4992A|nr:angiopoietin-related protein 1-like [Anopheles merus]
MDGSKIALCFVLISLYTAKVQCINGTASSLTGFGFEVLVAKLEHLQDKLLETEQKLSKAINQQDRTIERQLAALQAQSHKTLSLQTAWAQQGKLWNDIQALSSKEDIARFKLSSGLELASISSRSCKAAGQEQSGKFLIQPTAHDEPFLGYCVQQSNFGGGWLVIQHRNTDERMNFNRNWSEYRNGFGRVDGEFWFGLEHLHRLTSARQYELLVELKYALGNSEHARYSAFEIGSEVEQYSLKKLGHYTGTAHDLMSSQVSKKFTTRDRNNGTTRDGDCEGGWWMNPCTPANINGLRNKRFALLLSKLLVFTRMMIREV